MKASSNLGISRNFGASARCQIELKLGGPGMFFQDWDAASNVPWKPPSFQQLSSVGHVQCLAGTTSSTASLTTVSDVEPMVPIFIPLRLAGVSMHEMSIAQSLIEILKEEMEKHAAKSLRTVHLRIGQLSAIVPEALSFCFQVVTDGTEMEGAKLVMDMVPLQGYCSACQKEFEIKEYHFVCPFCRSTRIETIAGQDLAIVDMEVE